MTIPEMTTEDRAAYLHNLSTQELVWTAETLMKDNRLCETAQRLDVLTVLLCRVFAE